MRYRILPMAGDERKWPSELRRKQNDAIAAYMQLIDKFQYRADMARLTARTSAPIEWISEPTVHDIAQPWDDGVHFVDVRILVIIHTRVSVPLEPVGTIFILFEWWEMAPLDSAAPCSVRLH